MTKEELKKQVCEAIEAASKEIEGLACRIEGEPELGYKENRTAAKVAAYLQQLGLTPQTGLALTGVKACVKGKNKGPSVAVLAELDAIGTPDSPKADPLTGAAHTCGHFLQMATMLAAATGIVKTGVMQHLTGMRYSLPFPRKNMWRSPIATHCDKRANSIISAVKASSSTKAISMMLTWP